MAEATDSIAASTAFAVSPICASQPISSGRKVAGVGDAGAHHAFGEIEAGAPVIDDAIDVRPSMSINERAPTASAKRARNRMANAAPAPCAPPMSSRASAERSRDIQATLSGAGPSGQSALPAALC